MTLLSGDMGDSLLGLTVWVPERQAKKRCRGRRTQRWTSGPTDSGVRRGRERFGAGRDLGVARKTIYKWLARHEAEGLAGLTDRSRAPLHCRAGRGRSDCAHRRGAASLALGTAEVAGEAGRRRSVDRVARGITIGEVLKRAGLTHARKPRVRTPPYAQPFASVNGADQPGAPTSKAGSAPVTARVAIR